MPAHSLSANQLKPPPGSRHSRKRVGRGNASGHGTYSGKGMKGQKARAGRKPRRGFEGGQLPLIRRLARKRGFVNIFRVEYTPVNLARLDKFPAGSTISPTSLQEAGVIKDSGKPIKILADGELTKSFTIQAHKFSQTAQEKIEAAGGRAEVIT